MLLWDGFLHCDLHAGNIIVRPCRRPWYYIPFLTKWIGLNPYNFDVVLLDHGLYRSLNRQMRLDFCHLWTSLIRFDEAKIKEYAVRIFASGNDENVFEKIASIDSSIDAHRLFASMLTGRPWDVISQEKEKNSDDGNDDDDDEDDEDDKKTQHKLHKNDGLIDVTIGASTGGLVSLRSRNEKSTIKSKLTKRKFLSALTKVMAILPREVLLIIKTNDILRSVDRTLGVAGGSGNLLSVGDDKDEYDLDLERQRLVGRRMVRRFAWMVWYCSVAIRNERMKEARSAWAIADAWIDSVGILLRVVVLEFLC
ncbi:putative aarF domain-containing protein kinase 1 [Physocladia obscura]|uniref:AarF domain-containing protein kinase 1 n=1 Tax=Physocladia obscura TaxID=109957 RepID=A0AAD5T3E1_9FUNG|nr:putative aarF domain-containing protein kinase 1 [Physocladia obscura]